MTKENISNSHRMSEQELYKAYKIFFGTLVSNPRLHILNLLRSGRKNVSEIMKRINRDQTSVSHDLARLKRCGFVKVHIEGKYRYYTLNEKTIDPLMKMIEEHLSHHCVHILRNSHEKENHHH